MNNRVCEDFVYIFVHGEEDAELCGDCDFLQALVKYGLKLL